MDKNTTTGLILIGAVIMAFMFLNQSNDQTNSVNPVSQSSEVVSDVNSAAATEFKTTNDSDPEIEIDSADNIIFQKLCFSNTIDLKNLFPKDGEISNYQLLHGNKLHQFHNNLKKF